MAWGMNYKHDSLQAAIFKEDKQTNRLKIKLYCWNTWYKNILQNFQQFLAGNGAT